MSDQPTQSADPSPQSLWTRWWMILIYVVVGLIALGAIVNEDDSDTDPIAGGATTTSTTAVSTSSSEPETTTTADSSTTTTAASTTTVAETTTTSESSTTTSTQPTTTTTQDPVEGSGDNFIEFAIPGGNAAVLDISYEGGSNFSVASYDSNNESLDLLVNEIGSYQGRVPVNFYVDDEVAFLEITASGQWTIETIPFNDLAVTTGEIAGIGDDVVRLDVSSPALEISHDGESNFAVTAYSSDGRDLLVNEVGSYSGTVRAPTGSVTFEINADGSWSMVDT